MRFETMSRVIAANDPARNLRLGYAIVRRHGKIVKHADAVPPGSEFDVQFSDGKITAQRKNNDEK
jgi:exonuclease VII large subunit